MLSFVAFRFENRGWDLNGISLKEKTANPIINIENEFLPLSLTKRRVKDKIV